MSHKILDPVYVRASFSPALVTLCTQAKVPILGFNPGSSNTFTCESATPVEVFGAPVLQSWTASYTVDTEDQDVLNDACESGTLYSLTLTLYSGVGANAVAVSGSTAYTYSNVKVVGTAVDQTSNGSIATGTITVALTPESTITTAVVT